MEGLLLWRPPSCSSTIVEQTSSQGQCFWNPNGDALEKILRGKFPFQSSEWHHNVTLGTGYHQFKFYPVGECFERRKMYSGDGEDEGDKSANCSQSLSDCGPNWIGGRLFKFWRTAGVMVRVFSVLV